MRHRTQALKVEAESLEYAEYDLQRLNPIWKFDFRFKILSVEVSNGRSNCPLKREREKEKTRREFI